MTKPKGTRDLQDEIVAAMGNVTEPFAMPPSSGSATGGSYDDQSAWLRFADALDRGDTEDCRRFLADRQLPMALISPLAMVRPEAKRLETIVSEDVPESTINEAKATLGMLRQAHPTSVESAEKISHRIAELSSQITDMERKRDAAAYAKNELAGLQNVFSELLTGEPGRKSHAGLNPVVSNALVAAGLNPTEIYCKPWSEAFKLELCGTVRRRRLQIQTAGR